MTDSALIAKFAVRQGDDALVLGHRLSEWTSRSPFLEEDLALTNVALDFVGRARMFYQYAATLTGGDANEDTFAYTRDAREFSNLLICELPRGDFAFTICRQYLYDAFALPFMQALMKSSDQQLAAIAAKAEKETKYHVRRDTDWMLRLGDGTEESQGRMQKALDDLWGYTGELFDVDDVDRALIAEGIVPDVSLLRDQWLETVSDTIARANLELPQADWKAAGGRDGIHTESLGFLLAELQSVQRAYPGLKW
ncbi:phenylacetate-CoA oxygenase, PaaI subunit [Luminiphilus syltensis NOR5-1B]|uniref:Phenylacetate-CoA oxygenase, PaaI subunit n=1 Tax=Luminiphilus syltensis NOR5-1B TaxID=565045 RepID=B8KT79_9GAMM|nr:1,2-phenylacetyl-CoA epoxidase subunit PaaC [Luminiphilus syltensis]EED34755.1 phenylacetate-CoA oxygenase, PaaI subunit [Luminiphilus syltensis NOR5-1B]